MENESSPQLENGHFHIANELFEAMILKMPCRIPGPMAIFMAVMRETYGFNRKSAEISTDRFRKLTGITHRNNIYRAIKEAISLNLITAIKNDGRMFPIYSIQKKYGSWETAIKNDCAIKNDGGSNQKRLRVQSKMMAVCKLKTPSKDTYKDNMKSIPEDFMLTPGFIEFALKKKIPRNEVEDWFDAFKNKYLGNGEKKKNWAAAWFAYISSVAANRKKHGTYQQQPQTPTVTYSNSNDPAKRKEYGWDILDGATKQR